MSIQLPQLVGTLPVQLLLDLMLQPLIGCLEMFDLNKPIIIFIFFRTSIKMVFVC